jgi:Heat induced stress protein YflT
VENKKHMGTFHSIEALLYKITELTTQGYKDSDMFAVTKVEDNVSMFRGQGEMEPSGVAADNWLNRFKLFLSGDEVILDTFDRMGFSEQQSRVFYDETKAGGIALFVDVPNRNESRAQHLNEDEVISEMDSSAERGLSGEQLDGQEKTSQQIIDNTVPRIDTSNL